MKKLLTLVLTSILCFSLNTNAFALNVTYEEMNVPSINSSFKTWMDYRMCAYGSVQRNFSEKWGWVDNQGFMRCNGERDLGITDDYYLIALGSYYGTTIGTKYRITTNTGKVFYGILGDCKDDRHTNSTHQYCPGNKDIVEFLIYTPCLNSNVKCHGSANVYMPLNGSIAKIEKIHFN
jgi:hypothetical protein